MAAAGVPCASKTAPVAVTPSVSAAPVEKAKAQPSGPQAGFRHGEDGDAHDAHIKRALAGEEPFGPASTPFAILCGADYSAPFCVLCGIELLGAPAAALASRMPHAAVGSSAYMPHHFLYKGK